MKYLVFFSFLTIIAGCGPDNTVYVEAVEDPVPTPQYSLSNKQTHNKFSRTIEPVLTVPANSVIEFFTEEATDGQLTVNSNLEDLAKLSFDPIHPLTGPVFVEEAEPGDVLAVTLHKIELGDWGWTAITPGFGFLADEFTEPWLKTYRFQKGDKTISFNENIKLPVRPFAGVLGVAPDTDSLLNTIPPRANGGNMDDPNMVEGTTIYLPVFVDGALFSIGDAHATQGMGEVCGTAVEAPMRFIVELKLIKGRIRLHQFRLKLLADSLLYQDSIGIRSDLEYLASFLF